MWQVLTYKLLFHTKVVTFIPKCLLQNLLFLYQTCPFVFLETIPRFKLLEFVYLCMFLGLNYDVLDACAFCSILLT